VCVRATPLLGLFTIHNVCVRERPPLGLFTIHVLAFFLLRHTSGWPPLGLFTIHDTIHNVCVRARPTLGLLKIQKWVLLRHTSGWPPLRLFTIQDTIHNMCVCAFKTNARALEDSEVGSLEAHDQMTTARALYESWYNSQYVCARTATTLGLFTLHKWALFRHTTGGHFMIQVTMCVCVQDQR